MAAVDQPFPITDIPLSPPNQPLGKRPKIARLTTAIALHVGDTGEWNSFPEADIIRRAAIDRAWDCPAVPYQFVKEQLTMEAVIL